jgi:ribosomal protein S18 acetylase RimI-like enzyme
MLKIRPYNEGEDDAICVDVVNRGLAEFPDFTPRTLADVELEIKSPNDNKQGRFIAEWNNEPVGYVYAYVDPFDPAQKGDMEGPYVIPGFHRKHIGSELEQTACQSFRERKIYSVENWVRSDNIIAQRFLESRGFSIARTYSRMRCSLTQLPENVSENRDIKIVPIGNSETELALQLNLLNETMKEHHDYRPVTIEELMYYTENRPKLGERTYPIVAYLDNEPVGFLTFAIDQSENEHLKKIRAGFMILEF